MKIIPAILTNDTRELNELLRQIRDSKKFDRVQIDFVDGEYARNKSIGVADLPPGRGGLKYDAHLMVVEKNVKEYVQAAKIWGFDRIIAQVESISHPEDFTCLAVDLKTPVEKIEPYLLKLDLVVLMGVQAGQGGQDFDERVLDKIKKVSGGVEFVWMEG